MSSLENLHEEWSELRDVFELKIRDSETPSSISSQSEFATTAWHNRLKVWRDDLDRLIDEYSIAEGLNATSAIVSDSRNGLHPSDLNDLV